MSGQAQQQPLASTSQRPVAIHCATAHAHIRRTECVSRVFRLSSSRWKVSLMDQSTEDKSLPDSTRTLMPPVLPVLLGFSSSAR